MVNHKRAIYGAASILAIWQRRIEMVLQNICNVINFYDVLIFADTFENLMHIFFLSYIYGSYIYDSYIEYYFGTNEITWLI